MAKIKFFRNILYISFGIFVSTIAMMLIVFIYLYGLIVEIIFRPLKVYVYLLNGIEKFQDWIDKKIGVNNGKEI